MNDTVTLPCAVIEDTIHALERYAVKRQDFERFESELAMLKAALAAPQPVKQALIDAAPALYEALKGFYNNSIAADWPDDIYNNAKAALALVGGGE